MTISQRRDRLRQRLVAAELDAMLVSDLVNVRYLSGFTGSNAALLVRVDSETPVLVTDGLGTDLARPGGEPTTPHPWGAARIADAMASVS